MLTLAALRVLLLRNGIFPAVYFQLIVSPSRFLQLSQHRFLWSRRKIDHIWRHRQSSGGKTPFLVCVWSSLQRPQNLQNTLISVCRARRMSSAAHRLSGFGAGSGAISVVEADSLVVVVVVVGKGGGGSGSGPRSLDVFIARLFSKNLSTYGMVETLGPLGV